MLQSISSIILCSLLVSNSIAIKVKGNTFTNTITNTNNAVGSHNVFPLHHVPATSYLGAVSELNMPKFSAPLIQDNESYNYLDNSAFAPVQAGQDENYTFFDPEYKSVVSASTPQDSTKQSKTVNAVNLSNSVPLIQTGKQNSVPKSTTSYNQQPNGFYMPKQSIKSYNRNVGRSNKSNKGTRK